MKESVEEKFARENLLDMDDAIETPIRSPIVSPIVSPIDPIPPLKLRKNEYRTVSPMRLWPYVPKIP